MPRCPNCGEDNPERARFCMACTAPLVAPAAQGTRRTVTIVFSDLVGSTALGERLDSEALREALDRYFAEMRACLERHGGAVEKYIGDAVMAVFGLPRAHEDDALRALRAASDMKETLAKLNDELEARWGVRLSNRTGIHTGEVVAGDPATGQRLVTGDAVNTAARLEQAAPTGEVLVGEPTYRLAREAVEVEAVEAVAAKGKAEPVPAYRLVSVVGVDALTRHLDAPMVGRQSELQTLVDAFERACAERRCVLATVTGEAGVGKTRLVAEFLSRIGDRARVAQGRCLSYGEGITYWALSEAVRDAAGIAEGEPREVALEKLAALCRGAKEPDMIGARVGTAMGLAADPFPKEELAWGFRKLVEHLASERPLVMVLDDIQWADPTLLEAVVHIASLAKDAHALLLCIARPELEEEHARWSEGVDRRVAVQLEPLSEDDSDALVGGLLGEVDIAGEARGRIVRAAEGNPLFLEQMLSMWKDQGVLVPGPAAWELTVGSDELPIPPSIQALLAARLDGLIEHERAALERGAVVGQVFYRSAVEALSPEPLRPHVGPSLGALTQRRLIRPDDSPFVGDEAFAFVHLLVRDASYAAMLKRTRAELHEAFADWLTDKAGDRLPEYEEIVGYHLEQAYRNRVDLGPPDERARGLRNRASGHLSGAARRAFAIGDMRAASALYERALSLLPEDDTSMVAALPYLAAALIQVGDFGSARSVLVRAEHEARSMEDRRTEMLARVTGILLSLADDPQAQPEPLRRDARKAIEVFLGLDDDSGLAKAFHALGQLHWWECQFERAEEAFWKAIHHAERAGDRREVYDNLAWVAVAAWLGPAPVDEGLRRCADILKRAEGDRLAQVFAGGAQAALLAMRGAFDEARTTTQRNRVVWKELGWVVEEAAQSQLCANIELLAGDVEAAERELRWGCDVLDRMGEKGYLSTSAGMLANVLASTGRLEEAERYIRLSAETGAANDIQTQVEWRTAKAEVLIQRRDVMGAAGYATDAAELADRTDHLHLRGGARMELARVLSEAGRIDEAIDSARKALEDYERKGNIVSAARAREFLQNLEDASESG